jgi:hypothetical protein
MATSEPPTIASDAANAAAPPARRRSRFRVLNVIRPPLYEPSWSLHLIVCGFCERALGNL